MSTSAELLALQSNIKKDPDGYKDEFMLQYRHYVALLDIFKLRPSKEAREFGELVAFLAQVSRAYPKTLSGFPGELAALLDAHAAVLEPALRRSLVGALILLRNRGQVDAMAVLPLFFRLFRCQDKALRQQLFRHIVADLKAANRKSKNERLNRAVQNFMYSVVSDDNEAAAKRGLAVLTEMWRRHVWRDARTVNVIASAAFHKSPRVLLAVMKFFMGQDKAADGDGGDGDGSDDEDGPGGGGGGGKTKPTGPTKEEVYSAYHKGTRSSKKKKQHKLKRVLATVKKAARRGREGGPGGSESFAAMHLLHDPQTFAEKLLARLQGGNERFETRMAVVAVVSRIIGLHKLLVLNFYPYLQKYIAPHTRDVTAVLAALVQAAHDLVPPDVLAPVLRQLVDQFVHDKARPEVMTVGLKTVRELCLRSPLLMPPDLLADLAAYRKYREKEVSSAARGLVAAFRDLHPEMLAKKDRGRGADLALKPRAYGDAGVASRVDGAELLEAALAAGRTASDDEAAVEGYGSDGSDDGSLESLDSGDWEDVAEEGEEEEEEEGGKGKAKAQPKRTGKPAQAQAAKAKAAKAKGKGPKAGAGEQQAADGGGEAGSSDLESLSGDESGGEWEDVSDGEGDEAEPVAKGEAASGSGSEEDEDEDEEEEEEDGGGRARRLSGRAAGSSDGGSSDEEEEEEEEEDGSGSGSDGDGEGRGRGRGRGGGKARRGGKAPQRSRRPSDPESLASLKKRLAEAEAQQRLKKRQRQEDEGAQEQEGAQAEEEGAAHVPIEAGRILSQEDFDRIKRLKQKALVEAALAKHGLAPTAASKAKRARALEAAEEEAEEALALRERLAAIGEDKVAPADLLGRHRARKDKAARLASVLEGREGRERFGSRSGLKKKKTAGLSEREKQRKKVMPVAARVAQIRRRNAAARGRGRGKNFKGHVRG